MIYITGDTHGEKTRFCEKWLLPDGRLTKDDYLIICGDFGYVFKEDETERLFLDELEMLPYTILFVDGNHENFPAIYSYPIVEWHGGMVHQIRKNIFHLMRGEIFEIEEKTFFTMGGAYSIDKAQRREGLSWWQEELPCDAEYKRAARNLEERNFKVDYVITHTLPHTMALRLDGAPDMHDIELTGFLDWVMYETDFKHWYCGHWHRELELTDKITILWFGMRTIE
ncbi:MAG: metallophosphoesterase [Clostridia bacterium]|nr:metallophosphoesterase [Clostridia bacterium]